MLNGEEGMTEREREREREKILKGKSEDALNHYSSQ